MGTLEQRSLVFDQGLRDPRRAIEASVAAALVLAVMLAVAPDRVEA